MKQHIPNVLTLANLFSGCCALVFLFFGQAELAVWCTAACFLFDTFDGVAARMMKVTSPIGKELDSLADMVSFGVAPGAMLFHLLIHTPEPQPWSGLCQGVYAALPAFILSAFSALRLAKFNIDTRQTTNFLGLTTPLCTAFVLGLSMAARQDQFGIGSLLTAHPWMIYLLVLILSALLVSELPLLGLKIKSFGWKGNEILFSMLGLTAILVWRLEYLGLPLMVVIYIFFSLYTIKKQTA